MKILNKLFNLFKKKNEIEPIVNFPEVEREEYEEDIKHILYLIRCKLETDVIIKQIGEHAKRRIKYNDNLKPITHQEIIRFRLDNTYFTYKLTLDNTPCISITHGYDFFDEKVNIKIVLINNTFIIRVFGKDYYNNVIPVFIYDSFKGNINLSKLSCETLRCVKNQLADLLHVFQSYTKFQILNHEYE